MSRIYKQIDFAKQTWDFPLSNTKVQYVCGVLCVYHIRIHRANKHPCIQSWKKGTQKKKRDRDKTWDMFLCQMNWFVRKLKIRTISNSFYLCCVWQRKIPLFCCIFILFAMRRTVAAPTTSSRSLPPRCFCVLR